MTKTTEQLYEELEEIRSEFCLVRDKLHKKQKQWEKSAEKSNQEKSKDIEWLVNNPDTPGQYEGLRKWMKEAYGGEYSGVTASGYYPETNQQSFGFTFGYDDSEVEICKSNIRKFVHKVLPLLKPTQDDLVVFSYATGEYSGIKQLAWDTVKKHWVTFETVYRRNKSFETWGSLSEALDYAYEVYKSVED